MRVKWARWSLHPCTPRPESLCLLPSQFYCSSYFLFDKAVQSCLYCGCTDSCSLTPIHRVIQQCLFPLTCSQKVCSTSLLLSPSLWIMYVTGICGNTWISAFQCKPSSHTPPLVSIRKFPSLGVHFTLLRVLTGSNIVCPIWKVNPMTQLSSALPPGLLPGKSHGRRRLVGCSPWGREESDTTLLSLSLFTFMHWRRKWQSTPVLLPGESQGRGSLVGCCLWGRTESEMTEVT